MPYGLKYVTQFNSQTDANNATILYTLQFLFKDYSGPVQSIRGGTTTAIQKCTFDDPLAPIKGQALDIQLLNYGNLPITSFYSDDDAGVQVILSDPGGVRFIGFIVQDDCSEIMVDYVHGIQLSATDSLGLLKDVILNEKSPSITQGSSIANIGSTAPHTLDISLATYQPPIGIPFIVSGGSPLDGTYTITAVTVIGSNHYQLTVVETVGNHAAGPSFIRSVGPVDLSKRQSLLTMIAVCLYYTNLSLLTNIFCNLREFRQTITESHFPQTFIDPATFYSSESYMNCYEVLSRILQTFGCQLMQVNGEWVIIHWFEMRKYPGGAIKGWQYDESWLPIGTLAYNNTFNIGRGLLSRPLFSIQQSVLRPYKFVRKTFNYVTPKYLLKNYDLTTLGALLRQYIDGANTVYEYDIPAGTWTHEFADISFIRVIVNNATQTEIDRYVYQPKINNGLPLGYQRFNNIQFNDIEVNVGDRFTFNLNIKSASSTSGDNVNYRFGFFLQVSDNQYYNLINGAGPGSNELRWNLLTVTPIESTGFAITIPAAEAENYTSFAVIDQDYRGVVPPFPANGKLRIRVYGTADTNVSQPNVDAIWKDIRFGLVYYINESLKITGQIHKENRTPDVKNNSDTEIFIDDSPKNSIQGTLVLNTSGGFIADLTYFWEYGTDFNGYKLGNISTAEDITVRDTPRSKLEGGCIGIIQNNQPVSLAANIVPDFYPTKTYIFGLLTIDYKHNVFSGTMWEIMDNAEADLVADYTFNYIYSTT